MSQIFFIFLIWIFGLMLRKIWFQSSLTCKRFYYHDLSKLATTRAKVTKNTKKGYFLVSTKRKKLITVYPFLMSLGMLVGLKDTENWYFFVSLDLGPIPVHFGPKKGFPFVWHKMAGNQTKLSKIQEIWKMFFFVSLRPCNMPNDK